MSQTIYFLGSHSKQLNHSTHLNLYTFYSILYNQKMKAFVLASLVALASAVAVPADSVSELKGNRPVSVSIDEKLNQGATSLNTVACSDGSNGLVKKGFSTLKSLPKYPLIASAPTVKGWNSPKCGQCYQLHYHNGKTDQTVNVLAVDAGPAGFGLSSKAMNILTHGEGEQKGRVQATFTETDQSKCGL